jgi:hypothetical protein
LFGGSSAVFAFANMLHLFPDELSSLRGWRFALARISSSTLKRPLFWHGRPPVQMFDA